MDFDSLLTNIEAFDVLPICHSVVAVELTVDNVKNYYKTGRTRRVKEQIVSVDESKQLFTSDLSHWFYKLILGLTHMSQGGQRWYIDMFYKNSNHKEIDIDSLRQSVIDTDFKNGIKNFFNTHYSDIPFDRFLAEQYNLNSEFHATIWNYVIDEHNCINSLEMLTQALPYKTFRSNILLLSCVTAEQIKSSNKPLWHTFWQRITKYQVLTRHMINRFAYTIITNPEWATNVIRHSPDLWGCDSKIIKLFKEKQIPQLV